MPARVKAKIVFPAEWDAQSGVMLTWPHRNSDWKNHLDKIERVYITLAKVISRYQKLLIICYDREHRTYINSLLRGQGILNDAHQLFISKTNDTWCRDYGPLTIRQGSRTRLVNFRFDGWGNKYTHDLDNEVNQRLANKTIFGEIKMVDYDFILEGGSLETDGKGTLLTTSNCLLKRHIDLNKIEIEQKLKTFLGVKTVHWLDEGSLGSDDTDSHIDNLARFSNPQTIVYAACNDSTHPDYASLKKMEAEIVKLKQTDGAPYNIVPIQIPDRITHKGEDLPASYINYLIINQAVLVPVYNKPQDQAALDSLRECFPERNIISINCEALIKHRGGLHCATMNLPAGALN